MPNTQKNVSFSLKKEFTVLSVLLIPIAVAINYIAGTLTYSLKLPLYLDMIGTFIVSILSGPFVGVATAVLTSIVKNIAINPAYIAYSMVSATVALFVGFATRKKLLNTLPRLLLVGLIVAIIASVMSVAVTVAFFGGFGSDGTDGLKATLMAMGLPFWPAQFIGSTLAELPDKLASLWLAHSIVKLMSNRYLIKFPNGRIFIDAKNPHSRP
ncbi:ECF transporter S component [Atopobacter sp. AH10]|uniref:ECF transporter S component n=1 Tax=Atopobacter sp. AH10 TaxID=2315861 RepID=UPI000EF17F98|nr:ECF transporter S component [Atopobacter sp. AH10]RLK63071.1 ECF transporter S component [Atopobacter sp. AH10]